MSALAHIAGIGFAEPPEQLSAEEFAELAARLCARVPRERALLHAMARRSGVERRAVAIVERTADGPRAPLFEDRPPGAPRSPSTAERLAVWRRVAPDLAEAAARRALAAAALDPLAITHLVVATCTGFDAPGVEFDLMDRLGLSPAVARVNVGFMGCHGAVNAGRVGAAFCAADPAAVALVVCVEVCSVHLQLSLDRDALLPNALFGDGAAALVMRPGDGGLAWRASDSLRLPQTSQLMTWSISDNGFRMTLDSSVPDAIARHLNGAVAAFLARHGVAIDDIAGWAIHPGGPRILEASLAALGLGRERGEASAHVLRHHGNLSSVTAPRIVAELLSRGVRGPVLMLAFGPGLVAEMALLHASESPEATLP